MTAPQTPGEVWDALVASLLPPESTPMSARRSARLPLRLHPRPTVRHLPAKVRQIGAIEGALRQTIRQLASGEAPWPLLIWGPVGTGKTCAALCLLDHAGGDYLTAAELAEKVIAAQQGRLEHDYGHGGDAVTFTPERYWAHLGKQPLIVLDELGARERVSDHAYESTKRLIDLREGRPLIALSNLDLALLAERYDDRIASRLAAGTVCRLEGEDRRLTRP